MADLKLAKAKIYWEEICGRDGRPYVWIARVNSWVRATIVKDSPNLYVLHADRSVEIRGVGLPCTRSYSDYLPSISKAKARAAKMLAGWLNA